MLRLVLKRRIVIDDAKISVRFDPIDASVAATFNSEGKLGQVHHQSDFLFANSIDRQQTENWAVEINVFCLFFIRFVQYCGKDQLLW